MADTPNGILAGLVFWGTLALGAAIAISYGLVRLLRWLFWK